MYRDTMSIWEGPISFAHTMREHNRIEKERIIQKLSCIHPKYDYPYMKLNVEAALTTSVKHSKHQGGTNL